MAESVSMLEVWLPGLLSVLVAFILSFLSWGLLRLHRNDWGKLPDEDSIRRAFQQSPASPGQYAVPHCAEPSQMRSDAHLQKVREGPVGLFILLPNELPNMTRLLASWFLFLCLTTLGIAYVATRALPAGAGAADVFAIVFPSAALVYCAGKLPECIWFGRTVKSTLREVADGTFFSLATAALFLWLWP